MKNPLARTVKHAARDESGQSHILGFALCLPVVLIAIFFLVGLCWLGWQTVSFNHALYQTSWTMDAAKLDRAIASGNTAELVHDAVAADWTMLDKSKLSVTNASISESFSREKQELTTAEDHEGIRIERTSRDSRFARVVADVSYTVTLPFTVAGVESVILERHIDKVQQVNFRFEVS